MFKFLHTADIHIDSPLRGLESYEDAPVEQIRQATRRAFDNLIDLAIEEQVSFILIAGDLYDGEWKDYHTGLFFIDRMSRLRKAGIRAFLVSGNHDAASQITRTLQLPDNVKQFPNNKPGTDIIENINVAIHGQSYKQRVVDDNLAAEFPKRREGCFNIGLLHTSLNGREGHEPYAPCSKDDLLSKGYDYWALGHVHQFEIVSKNPRIVFPGNIQGRHIKETGAKSAILVSVEDGNIIDIEQREVNVLLWAECQVDITGCSNIEDIDLLVRQTLVDKQNQAGGKILAVRLVITGTSPFHSKMREEGTERIRNFREIAVGLGDIWLEKVKFETRSDTSFEIPTGSGSPFDGLLKAVADLDLTPDSVLRLAPDISDLKSKLPVEVLQDDAIYLSDRPEATIELADEVKELLITSLLKQGRPE